MTMSSMYVLQQIVSDPIFKEYSSMTEDNDANTQNSFTQDELQAILEYNIMMSIENGINS